MNRDFLIKQLTDKKEEQWDIVVIGGGATGLGIAVDAASRGYKTVLFEQGDFSQGTSSRSTKLVHGGVRYLAQGDVSLVFEALHERGLLRRNAPHLVWVPRKSGGPSKTARVSKSESTQQPESFSRIPSAVDPK